MSISEGMQLSEIIREKLGGLKRLCATLDEATASRAPSGRWSPKEILSHLAGEEGVGPVFLIRLILTRDTPRLDIEPANPFLTGKRRTMTFAGLLTQVTEEYERMAELVAGLSDSELARTAHVPMLKETPLGEYPALSQFVRAMAEHHLDFHISHMKEILEALRGEG
jgi:hypothetical protein